MSLTQETPPMPAPAQNEAAAPPAAPKAKPPKKPFGRARLLRIVLINLACLVGLFFFFTQWRYTTVGSYAVRKNVFTGAVQIRRGGRFERSFVNNAQTAQLAEKDFSSIALKNVRWGPDGLVCGTAFNTSETKDVQGRLSLNVLQHNAKKEVVRNRSLRVNVDWRARTETPFVIDTNLPKPARGVRSVLRLEPIN